jgi:hypothetical protein
MAAVLPELPDLLDAYCDAAGIPQQGRPAVLGRLLADEGCDLSRGAPYGWFRRPIWTRPGDTVRPALVRLLKLAPEQELLLHQVITRGPSALSDALPDSPTLAMTG